jgi:hypothetical protein
MQKGGIMSCMWCKNQVQHVKAIDAIALPVELAVGEDIGSTHRPRIRAQ